MKTLFMKKYMVVLGAVVATLLWGSAFPCIKTGYELFGIKSGEAGSQMLFAGVRFVAAGMMTLVVSQFAERGERKSIPKRRNIGGILLLGLTQTCLQYVFYYIGMAHVTGIKGSIINGTSAFVCVLTAYIFYKNETMTYRKVLGCVLGLGGVIVVNVGKGDLGGGFSLMGEGFLLISAVVVALGALISKEVSKNVASFWLCGWQLLLGGVMLVILGTAFGGKIDWKNGGMAGIWLMVYMALLSAAAFSIWTILLKYNEMGKVTVFNFLIPVFGTVLSALVLGENLWNVHILMALPMVCLGIYLVNTGGTVKQNK